MATAKGTKQLNVGIAEELMEQLQAFVDQRGEKLRAVVEMALRRHMANPPPDDWTPPPPTFPPLPPVTPPADAPQAKPRKAAGKKPKN